MTKWPTKKLGDALEKIVGGGTPSVSNPSYWDGDIPWASVKDIKENESVLERTQDFITKKGLENSASNLIPAGTIIISTRMGLGRAVRTKIDTAINQDLKALFPKKDLDPEYLLFFLKNMAGDFIKKGSGATVSGIKLDFLRSVEIPLPPLAEQKKIVAKIEKVFAKVDEMQHLQQEAIADTKALRTAILDEIFSVIERESRFRRGNWEITTIDRVCEHPQYGYTASAQQEPIGPKFLRITDIQNGTVDWEQVPYCRCRDPKKYQLYDGDIVFARTGATVGKSYLVNDPPKAAIYASYLIRLRATKDCILPSFLAYFFQSNQYWKQITDGQVGMAQSNVNGSKLAKLKLPLPPLAEQKKIARELDALSEKVQALRKLQADVGEDLKELKKAILREAFNQ